MTFRSKIILHIPHSSVDGLEDTYWSSTQKLLKAVHEWTDWHTQLLFAPNKEKFDTKNDFQMIVFNKNRFVVDVERIVCDPLEKVGQGIIYEVFDNELTRKIDELEIAKLKLIYHKHHELLRETVSQSTRDLTLIDCHSFPSKLANVDICLGYNEDFTKPSQKMIDTITDICRAHGLTISFNMPYSNTIQPLSVYDARPSHYTAFMLEINKRAYMDELTLCLNDQYNNTKNAIESIYTACLDNS